MLYLLLLVRKKLEVALESCHKANYNYQSDMEIARHKVKEALEMVEKTNSKKDKLVTDLEKSNGYYNLLNLKCIIYLIGK